MWWIDIIFCAVSIFAGYVGACCYLTNTNVLHVRPRTIKLTPKRIAYLIIGVASIATLAFFLNVPHALPLPSRINLLSLALLILPVSAIDSKLQKIPNIFLLVGLIVRLLYLAIYFIQDVSAAWNVTKDSLLGCVIIGLFFIVLLFVFKNSVGMGDIKLFALMGLYQGLWGVINSVFFSLTVSFFLSIALLITKKKGRKDTISFGPSIYLGTIIAICMAGI